jgi:hypothetical protein
MTVNRRTFFSRGASIALLALLFIGQPLSTASQTRRRRTSTRRPSAAKAATDARADAERREGAERAAAQIKTLTQFLYLLGGVTKGIEATDLAVRNREASPTVIQQAERNKATIKDTFRNVRVGLENLETDFSSKPGLRPYYQHFLGITDTAAVAEKQAAANQFDQAGRSLLKAVNQLTDGLLAMQGGLR